MPQDTASELFAELRAFFGTYVAAFAAEDADAVAALWDEVALFPSPNGNFAMEREAFRDHCKGLFAFYRKQGVATPTGALMSCHPLLPDVAMAEMAYHMLDHEGAEIASWTHHYVLRKSEHWRVSLTIADDEMATWAKLGATL